MVEFERTGSGFRLVAVIDLGDDDILGDLVEAQRDDLRRELADADRSANDLMLLPYEPPCRFAVGGSLTFRDHRGDGGLDQALAWDVVR